MEDNSIKLTREELYEKVWSMPATKLAKEFEIPDVALGKRCKKLDIPRRTYRSFTDQSFLPRDDFWGLAIMLLGLAGNLFGRLISSSINASKNSPLPVVDIIRA